MKNGIYFNMTNEDYHAKKALGSSFYADFEISPLTAWTRSNMNPNPKKHKESDSLTLGSAIHTYLLEGEAAYAARYVEKPEGMNFANKEGKDWKAAEIAGANRVILNSEPSEKIGRIIPILRASQANKLFEDGYPEVSIFWKDEHGTEKKCRIDWWRATGAIDVKTFANMLDKDIETAITHALVYNRYDLKAVHYMEGLEAGRQLIKAGKIFDPEGNRFSPDLVWTDSVERANVRFAHLFIQTDQETNVRFREFVKLDKDTLHLNEYWRSAKGRYDHCGRSIREHLERFGSEPWVEEVKLQAWEDYNFPAWALMK